MSRALDDVAAERRRQIDVEGWTPWLDDQHDAGTLAIAGACYAMNASSELHPLSQDEGHWRDEPPEWWLFEKEWWKPKGPRRDLVRAAALLIAEIERMDRASETIPACEMCDVPADMHIAWWTPTREERRNLCVRCSDVVVRVAVGSPYSLSAPEDRPLVTITPLGRGRPEGGK